MIVDKINQYLYENELIIDEAIYYEIQKIAGATFKRQFMENKEKDGTGKIWFSQVGKCARQLAYQYHGVEKQGKEIDGRAKLIFWTGDLIELTIVGLAQLAGVVITGTGLQQIRKEIPINGGSISGRPDGVVFADDGNYLLEVKSMSSFRFREFEKGIIDETYLAQINIGMHALHLDKCVIVGYNKDNGVMHEIIKEKDENILQQARENVMSVLHSTPESLPEPAYKANDKGHYPWQCLYCAWWGHCRKNAEKVLVGKSYKLREKEEAA